MTFSQIKWQGKAHIHATWETNAALAQYRGIRRLENYFRKAVLVDIQMNQSGSNIPPEEKEKYNLDREQEADALLQHTKVERVIDMGKGDDGNTTYYVKCMYPAFLVECSVLNVYRARYPLRRLHLGRCGASQSNSARGNRSLY